MPLPFLMENVFVGCGLSELLFHFVNVHSCSYNTELPSIANIWQANSMVLEMESIGEYKNLVLQVANCHSLNHISILSFPLYQPQNYNFQRKWQISFLKF